MGRKDFEFLGGWENSRGKRERRGQKKRTLKREVKKRKEKRFDPNGAPYIIYILRTSFLFPLLCMLLLVLFVFSSSRETGH